MNDSLLIFMSVAITGDSDVSKERYEERFDSTEERDAFQYSSMTYCSTHDCAICLT